MEGHVEALHLLQHSNLWFILLVHSNYRRHGRLKVRVGLYSIFIEALGALNRERVARASSHQHVNSVMPCHCSTTLSLWVQATCTVSKLVFNPLMHMLEKASVVAQKKIAVVRVRL